MLAKLRWIYWWKQNTKITSSIIIIWGWERKYFPSLRGVANLNTTAEIKSSIPQSPWHGVTLQLEEKLRILTKVKLFHHTFCYAMGSLLWREGDRWKIRTEKFLCSILCQLLPNKICRNIYILNFAFLLTDYSLAWDFMLQTYGRMAKMKTPFNILTGEIILGLYNYVKAINSKCRKCSIDFKKGKSLF